MEDRIVNRETALLAKEKGLPRFLDIANNLTGYSPKWKGTSYWHVHMSFPPDEEFLYAPTQSLLQKWLREEHNIHVWVSYDRGSYYPFMDCIVDLKQTNRFTTGYKKTYEKALESGLFKALNLIQNEKDNN